MKLEKVIIPCICLSALILGCAKTDTFVEDQIITGSTISLEVEYIADQTIPEESISAATETSFAQELTELPSSQESENTTATSPTIVVTESSAPSQNPAHIHSYTSSWHDATCKKPPYIQFTCSCGHSYQEEDKLTPPNGHQYCFKYATIEDDIWTERVFAQCEICKDTYSDTVQARALSPNIIMQIEERAAYWLNEYRKEEGAGSCQLPVSFQVIADYRATQLFSDFSHNTEDLREACAHFQYGEYKQPEGWDPSEYYYTFGGAEAIATGFINTEGIDATGKQLADMIRSSSSHWSYISDPRYNCMAVGIAYRPGQIVGVVFVSEQNFG